MRQQMIIQTQHHVAIRLSFVLLLFRYCCCNYLFLADIEMFCIIEGVAEGFECNLICCCYEILIRPLQYVNLYVVDTQEDDASLCQFALITIKDYQTRFIIIFRPHAIACKLNISNAE